MPRLFCVTARSSGTPLACTFVQHLLICCHRSLECLALSPLLPIDFEGIGCLRLGGEDLVPCGNGSRWGGASRRRWRECSRCCRPGGTSPLHSGQVSSQRHGGDHP